MGTPRFQTGRKVGHIGTEQVAAAFHHQGFGRQREAEIERIGEDVADPFTTRRIGGRETEIDAIKRLRRPEIPVSRDLFQRCVPVAFKATTVVWPFMRSALKTATPAVVFPTSPEVPSNRYTGVLRSVSEERVSANCRIFAVSPRSAHTAPR
jgi:hypothetical protein